MRTLCGIGVVLLGAGCLMAQSRSGFVTPVPVVRSFGSVVQPGSPSGLPGVQRTTGSVIFPGGSTQIGIPGISPAAPNFTNGRLGAVPHQTGRGGVHRGGTGGTIVPYPVYIPAYYDNSYYGGGTAPITQPEPQQPNVTVIYPPQQAHPVIINMGSQDIPQQTLYQPEPRQQAAVEQPAEPDHYLLAFKDHSIYSAVAYWVDGDTVHYFTAGNTHNQASLSLVDRELTDRLNRESGHEVKLPPAK